jgi:hypothetical protein
MDGGKFINFALNLKDDFVTISIATRQEATVLSYNLKNQKINIVIKK